MIATVQFNIDVRRKDDTAALTAELEKLFRQHTVGDDEITIITDTRKRGGMAQFWAEIEGEREDIQARIRAIGDAVNENMNLIDRVDEFVVAAHAENKILGFYRGDYRGWLREATLDDLREAARA